MMDPFADPSIKLPTLVPGFIRESPCTLKIHCHDRVFKSVDVIDSSTGDKLFHISSPGATSFSWRRSISTSTGDHLFDLRHKGYAMLNDWSVESPSSKTRLASLKHVKGFEARNRSMLDAVIHGENAADDVGETIEIRPRDRGALTTCVSYKGVEMATILNTEANDVYRLERNGLDRTVWEAHVNASVDLTFVSFVETCSTDFMVLERVGADCHCKTDIGGCVVSCGDGTCVETMIYDSRSNMEQRDTHHRHINLTDPPFLDAV